MKKLLNEELRQITNIVSSMPKTIKESMDYDVPQDEPIDITSFDAPSEEEAPVAPEAPQQPAQEAPQSDYSAAAAALIVDIRKRALRAMADLADTPDDPNYELLKRVFQLCEKSNEVKKGAPIEKDF